MDKKDTEGNEGLLNATICQMTDNFCQSLSDNLV